MDKEETKIVEAESVSVIAEDGFETVENSAPKKGFRKVLNALKSGGEIVKEKTIDFAGKAKDIADVASAKVKEESVKLVDHINDTKEQNENNKYGPVFPEDEVFNYHMPAMVSISSHDQAMSIPRFKEAIAFDRRFKEGNVLVVKPNKTDSFSCTFYPEKKETVYYVHPADKTRYIELDDYFTTLQTERVAELRHIAQALGATHFKVTIKEEKTSIERVEAKVNAKAGAGKEHASASGEHNKVVKEYSFIGIADESNFAGKEPVLPNLLLWRNDTNIRNLIEARMDKDSPLLKTKYTLNYNTSSGIKVKDAGKVSGLLKHLKFEGAGNIVSQAEQESKRVLEYEIEFKPY